MGDWAVARRAIGLTALSLTQLIVVIALFATFEVGLIFRSCNVYQNYRLNQGINPKFLAILWMLSLLVDALSVLLGAGIIGPVRDSNAELTTVRRLAVQRRVREIELTLEGAVRSVSGPALALAALFEHCSPDTLVHTAVLRFRCVHWEVLAQRRDVITCAAPLDGECAAEDLYALSESCQVGDCDVFLSHSWHDDPDQKWEALEAWCTQFEATHGRPPRLWLDKLCINQKDIKADLACLPVFLAACAGMLIIAGPTYTSRLWCCVELFVYWQMSVSEHGQRLPEIIELGADATRRHGHETWARFDAWECQCAFATDKARIFKVIRTFPGGIVAFNEYVSKTFAAVYDAKTTKRNSLLTTKG